MSKLISGGENQVRLSGDTNVKMNDGTVGPRHQPGFDKTSFKVLETECACNHTNMTAYQPNGANYVHVSPW